MDQEALRARFGERIQRCYGCFVAFYLKDMYLGEGGAFYCGQCRDDTMFHFDDFSRRLDLAKLPSLRDNGGE